MLCDSSFCYNDILPAGQTLLLKISFLDSQQHTGAAGGKVQAALQITGIRARRGPSQESSMVLPCVKLPLAMTTSSV